MDYTAFERQEQIVEYIHSMRSRFLPLKFAYIGQAAHTHDELVRSREYGIADTEATLIRSKLAQIIPEDLKGTGINIVDIGGGNGLKATHVIKVLMPNVSNIYYYSLDYSSELSAIALRNVTSVIPSLAARAFIIDFEKHAFQELVSQIKQLSSYNNLFLLLGHTLGNPANRGQALSNISQSMNRGDYLLVGVELYQPSRISSILNHYQN